MTPRKAGPAICQVAGCEELKEEGLKLCLEHATRPQEAQEDHAVPPDVLTQLVRESEASCTVCGKPRAQRKRARTCGERACVEAHQLSFLKSTTIRANSFSWTKAHPAPAPVVERECSECAEHFRTRLASKLTCGDACSKARNLRLTREARAAKTPRRPKVIRDTTDKHPHGPPCRSCGHGQRLHTFGAADCLVVGEKDACGCRSFRVAPEAQWAMLAAGLPPVAQLPVQEAAHAPAVAHDAPPPAAHAATQDEVIDYDTVDGAVAALEEQLQMFDYLRDELAAVLEKAKAAASVIKSKVA